MRTPVLAPTEVGRAVKVRDYLIAKEQNELPLVDLLPHQIPPEGEWEGWLIQAGRGSGKTAGVAKYVTDHANGPACIKGDMPHKMALVAPKLSDAVESADRHPVCLRTLSGGVLQTKPGGTIFTFPNGSEMKLFGVYTRRDVEALRAGGNNCLVWVEELAAWPYLSDGWDQMQLGLRIGPNPHWVGSSTPKRRRQFKEIVEDPNVRVSRAHLNDNPYLSEKFRQRILRKYGHTSLARQEVAGELVDEVDGALWNHEQIDKARWAYGEPSIARAVVAVDPPGGATEAGIVTAGLIAGRCPCGGANQPHAVVTHDDSLMPSGPNHWASVAINRYHDSRLDKLVGEVNYGGDMVLNTVANLDSSVNAGTVRATRGKIVRAEPIAGLYGDPARKETWPESRVHHLDEFPQLEDEMTSFTQAEAGQWSPNRLDALVWAITELGLATFQPAQVAEGPEIVRHKW